MTDTPNDRIVYDGWVVTFKVTPADRIRQNLERDAYWSPECGYDGEAMQEAIKDLLQQIDTLRATIDTLRASAQSWALYAFRQHGDDATLYNGLADLGGVSPEGAGWKHDRLTGGGLVRHDEIAGKD